MASSGSPRAIRRHRVLVMRTCAVLVVAGGLGLAWVATRPPVSKFCSGGAPIDEVGGPTPEAARTRWGGEYPLQYDVERPDRTSGSGDRATAIYLLPTPKADWADPDHTFFEELVTERGNDGVWRVVGASKCEQWTGI